MLSCNQLKVSEGERDNDRGGIGAEVLLLRAKSSFLERERRHKDNEQKTYDNKTEEHKVGRGQYLYQTVRQIWGTKAGGTDKEKEGQGKGIGS